jgi:hypothetical protein
LWRKKSKEWNTFRIVADGNKLTHSINGTLCMTFVDKDKEGLRTEGYVALELHDANVQVKFKDIRVKILDKAGAAPVTTEPRGDDGKAQLNPDAGTYAALGTGMVEGIPNVPAKCVECHKESLLQPRTTKSKLAQTNGNPTPIKFKHPFKGGRRAYNPTQIKFNQQTLQNLTRVEFSRMLLAPLAQDAGGYGICESKSGKPVLTSCDDPEYQSIYTDIKKNKDKLDAIKRFDMDDFMPSVHYLRELKRYGILPPTHEQSDPIDCYAVDKAYWRSFWCDPGAKSASD